MFITYINRETYIFETNPTNTIGLLILASWEQLILKCANDACFRSIPTIFQEETPQND